MSEPQLELTRLEQISELNQVVFRDVIDSTNSLALELIRTRSISPPTLVGTNQQTAGRGQRERTWISSQGSLTFSLVLKVNDSPLTPILSGLIIAMAIEEAVVALTPDAEHDQPFIRLKWPNDLFLSGRKLGGILVERALEHSVIGIGVNVNNSPPSIHSPARSTSLKPHVGPLDLNTLCHNISSNLVSRFHTEVPTQLGENEKHQINQRLLMAGERIVFESPSGQQRSARVRGIDMSGGLVLESQGQISVEYSGRILLN